MNTIIVYGSEYGTTEAYARQFASIMNVPWVSYDQNVDFSSYDRILYFGALYAGGVKGLKDTVKRMKKTQKLVLFTVGLADPEDEQNVSHIRNSILHQIGKDRTENTSMYHLRGGIDYSNLKLSHRTMMNLLYLKARSLPVEQQTADSRALVETYNQKVSFMDYERSYVIAESLMDRDVPKISCSTAAS